MRRIRGWPYLPVGLAVMGCVYDVRTATLNTINIWAAGIRDTFALGILNEALGLGLPVVIAA